MKRLISLLLVLVVVLTALVSCGNKEKDYSLAIGVVLTEKLASNKLTQTVATIVTDADGKIVLCRLDCVDFTAKYAEDGTLNTTAPTSKVAQGESYMMPSGSWASQGKALENYVVGKNQAEVAAIALYLKYIIFPLRFQPFLLFLFTAYQNLRSDRTFLK